MNPPTFISSVEENSFIGSSDNSSPTSTAEAQPIKRKRLTQACDACRKKKVKCSGEKPSCNNCTRLGTTCTYLPSTRKRGPRVGLVESLEKRLQQMEKLLKEQGFTDDIDDEQTSHPEKKQRSDSEDKIHSIPDNSYSTFLGDSVNFAGANLQNHHNNHNHNHSNNNNNNNNNNNHNHNKFQRVSGAFDNSSQQSKSSYPQNDLLNLLPNSQKASQMNQLPSPNGQMPRVMERQINNDNFREDKHNSSDSTNVEKKVEEPLFFGKTSARPGYIHHSEFLCEKDAPSTNQTPPGSASSEDVSPNIISPMSSAVISNIINGYPRLEIIEHLASCYFRHIDIMIPIFHEPTFMKQLRLNKVSSFLVFAMCAVSSRFATHPSIARNPPRSAGDQFAAVANTMIYQSFDYPSVEHVQALILLAFHLLGTCKGPKAWMYIGMAVRMAQEIGLHKVDETPANTGSTRDKSETVFIQKEIRRRTFWSCFLLDRYSSCAVGRPTLIDEDDCDVRLPCNEAIWNYDHPYSKSLIDEYYNEVHVKQDTRMTLTNNGLFACLVSVTALLGRVSHFVNRSKPSNSLPPWNPQSQFTMLADELEMWYRSLSPHYTYSKERLRKLMTNGTGAIFASFHLLYHASVIVLNRPNTALSQDNGGIEACGFARASAERCSVAAIAVSSICADIFQHGFQSLCLFVLYPTFVTSTVLINDLYSSDSAAAAEAKKNLETCEEFLTSLEPYWAMGGKLLLMIKEIRKQREEKSRNTFNNPDLRNFEQTVNEVLMGTDSGLLAFWNRTANVVDNNLDNISSVILPEQLLIPRWLDLFNDSSIANGSLSNLLRSSDPFSPRTRLFKKDKNSNEENSTEEDYFSQDVTQYNSNYPPPVFNGYPIVDMSTINQNTYDWTTGRISPQNRPLKHWSTVTSDSMTGEPSTSDCRSSSNNASNTS